MPNKHSPYRTPAKMVPVEPHQREKKQPKLRPHEQRMQQQQQAQSGGNDRLTAGRQ